MASRNRTDDIRVIGDFVCETIPDAPSSAAPPTARGESEGIRVVGDFTVDVGSSVPGQMPQPGNRAPADEHK